MDLEDKILINDEVFDPISLSLNTEKSTRTEIVEVKDYQKITVDDAEKNLSELYSTGLESMKEILRLAKDTESARVYEVANAMLKNLIDINNEIIKNSKINNTNKGEEITNQNNVQNNIYINSTEDVLKLLGNNINKVITD